MELISPDEKEAIIKKLSEQDAKYPVIEVVNAAGEKVPKYFGYGTAGFRTTAAHLERVCFRTGILCALRAKLTCLCGLMVTASHNPAVDNGVKIIENNGSMMDQSWEPLAEKLANAPDLRAFLEEFDNGPDKLTYGLQESIFAPSSYAECCFALDTRESGPALVAAAKAACEIMGVTTCNHGVVTTPQLHWLVSNKYTHSNDSGLYTQHCREVFMAFLTLCEGEKKNYSKQIILDCANGVGSVVMTEFLGLAGVVEKLAVTMIHDEKAPENLNEGCGAEHVHSKQTLPTAWNADYQNMKCVSFDGDADR